MARKLDVKPLPKCKACKTETIEKPGWKLGYAKTYCCPNKNCKLYRKAL